jgi:hypothetical protein
MWTRFHEEFYEVNVEMVYDRDLLREVMAEVPSFWEWRVDEPFWRPPGVDDSVRRVVFTLPSVADCKSAEWYKDSRGKPVTKVGARIAREVEEILKYYPSVSTVELRGRTSYVFSPDTRSVPYEVTKLVSSLKDVKMEECIMQENPLLMYSVVGFDDAVANELRYCRLPPRGGHQDVEVKRHSRILGWFRQR